MKRTLLIMAAIGMMSAIPSITGEEHVTICHLPPGNPTNVQIITIGESAVPFHLTNHEGDSLYVNGACGGTVFGG